MPRSSSRGSRSVALGTAVSDSTWASVVVMAVVAFVAVFLATLGGYFSAATITVILSYVLAVMIPAPDSQIWEREVGWVLGAGLAGVSALVLWPAAERVRVRHAAADLADALASVLEGGGADARRGGRRARPTSKRAREWCSARPAARRATVRSCRCCARFASPTTSSCNSPTPGRRSTVCCSRRARAPCTTSRARCAARRRPRRERARAGPPSTRQS